MGNGGSPPVHLPSSTDPNPFKCYPFVPYPWVPAKWMQPPARAPNFMDRWHSNIWPIIGTDDSYISRGMLDDLYAAKGKPRIVRQETPGDAADRV
jgi:hypothetical protein